MEEGGRGEGGSRVDTREEMKGGGGRGGAEGATPRMTAERERHRRLVEGRRERQCSGWWVVE